MLDSPFPPPSNRAASLERRQFCHTWAEADTCSNCTSVRRTVTEALPGCPQRAKVQVFLRCGIWHGSRSQSWLAGGRGNHSDGTGAHSSHGIHSVRIQTGGPVSLSLFPFSPLSRSPAMKYFSSHSGLPGVLKPISEHGCIQQKKILLPLEFTGGRQQSPALCCRGNLGQDPARPLSSASQVALPSWPRPPFSEPQSCIS